MKMSKYKVSEPSALKFLKANGAVIDENGNVVSDASDYWKKVYDQAEPKVAKYLHADGTIDENPGSGGGGSDLEDNKEETIDVSTYTEPVEITPTEGKDGMKKATVTLSNIPSPSGGTYNAYYCSGGGISAEWAFTKETMTPESTSFTGVIIADSDVYIFNNAPISYEYSEESQEYYWVIPDGPDLYFDEDWQNNFKQIVTF
jgi:hypothetical protein